MCKRAVSVIATAFFLSALLEVRAGDDDVAVETLLTGLTNPCGVAIRPSDSTEAYEIFVADSGAGRIVRLKSDDKEKSPLDVVTGYSLANLGNTGFSVGPVALQFLDRKRLVVGASGDAGARLQLFELDEAATQLTANSPKQQITLKTDDGTLNHVYALVRTRANQAVRDAMAITCFDNAYSGDVRTVVMRVETLTELALLTASKSLSEDFPAAITVSDGGYIVVACVGSLKRPRDSQLAFYNPASGTKLLELSTNLHDILALAYSPRTGNLYAADATWNEPKNGGVFRLDAANEAGASKCNAVKIADVVRPSALAFGPDGTLYVTSLGDFESVESAGTLLRITGAL